MLKERVPIQPIEQENYHDVMESGLQQMRMEGEKKVQARIAENHAKEARKEKALALYEDGLKHHLHFLETHLYTTHNLGKFTKNLPQDFLLKEFNLHPEIVGTGKISVVENKREIVTDGLSDCVAVLAQSPKGKALAHMVYGDNPANFGFNVFSHMRAFQGQDAFDKMSDNQDLIPRIADKLIENMVDINEGNLSVILIANVRDELKTLQLQRIKQALLHRGLYQVKIQEVEHDYSAVYHSPKIPHEIAVLGVDDQGNQYETIHITTEGDDVLLGPDSKKTEETRPIPQGYDVPVGNNY